VFLFSAARGAHSFDAVSAASPRRALCDRSTSMIFRCPRPPKPSGHAGVQDITYANWFGSI
jgi:hypothetical protein